MEAPTGPSTPVVHQPFSYNVAVAAAPAANSASQPATKAVRRSAPEAPSASAVASTAGMITAEPWTNPA